MNINKIKYYPDKFYLCLDGFDLQNLNTFTQDATFSQQQAVYLHEYYHYLTNLTTFAGLREFNVNFQDKIRIITRLSAEAGLDAYPIKDNKIGSCKDDIDYWNSVVEIINSEDINYKLAEEVENSIEKKFRITSLDSVNEPLGCIVKGETIKGIRIRYDINIEGLIPTDKFKLTISVIDEFLSSSIDEFMFVNDLADNCDVIRNRPFYPYGLYDEILKHYGIDIYNPLHKILIAYCSLHSFNPVDTFVTLLTRISENKQDFMADAIGFLNKYIDPKYGQYFQNMISYEKVFIKECESHGRINLRDTIYLLYTKSCYAYDHIVKDFFYFVRPFMISNIQEEQGKTEFLKLFNEIKNGMDEPLILINKQLKDSDSNTYKSHLAMLIAIYEIMDSLYENRIARRTERNKERFSYPVETKDDDLIENMPNTCPLTHTWHVALNELGLYGEYLKLK